MKVYLDNCCMNRPYDDQSQRLISLETQAKLSIQDLIKSGQIDLVASYMLIYENSQNPYDIRKVSISSFIEENAIEYVAEDCGKDIGSLAHEIMETGIKEKDAIHVACAILSSCDYFISTDRRLLKYKTDRIKMVNPIDFVQILEDE